MRAIWLSAFLFSAACFAQTSGEEAKPVEGKRIPATEIPAPDKYPFEMMIKALEQAPPAAPVAPAGQKAIPAPQMEVPKDFKGPREGPLTETEKDALSTSQAWQRNRNTPAEGSDGRVIYTYGAGLPTVICAPLRVCVVELQPGERLTGEPHIGDSVRWDVSSAVVGAGTAETSMIVIKPRSIGLDTNLLLTTDRRAYYLRLVSRSDDYIARIGFEYPEDGGQWKEQLAKEAEARKRREFEASQIAPVESMEKLYFDYRIKGGDENMRPVRVVDDGHKTFIQMTRKALVREAPILVILGPDGPEMVNYRVKEDMYIVDRLFERGALIIGVGKKARRAEIIRGTYNARNIGSSVKGHDPYADFTREDVKK
jgi:type IV secretion system protein VirB9